MPPANKTLTNKCSLNTPLIDDDGDARELRGEDFALMRPLGEVDPELAALSAAARRGRPKSDRAKEAIKLRIDADVLDAFRASGEGRHTRINDALADWVKARDMRP
ncbi:MAG: BrnA antitoxin family protein [Rickettsiales bacterium]